MCMELLEGLLNVWGMSGMYIQPCECELGHLNVWRMSGMYIQPWECVWSYLNVWRMSAECLEYTFSLVNVYGPI